MLLGAHALDKMDRVIARVKTLEEKVAALEKEVKALKKRTLPPLPKSKPEEGS